MAELESVDLLLDEDSEGTLRNDVQMQLSAALESHRKKEDRLAEFKKAYKARPREAKKTFPWVGASNVIIPIVGITVDGIVARLMRAFMGTKDLVECEIESAPYETFEKDFRDWASLFFMKSGARDRCRTMFHDGAIDGTAYFKIRWDSLTRLVQAYSSDGGAITSTEVVDYEGPVWDEIPASDVVIPDGFDEWKRLPWVAHRLRLTWAELKEAEKKGMYTLPDDFKTAGLTERKDPGFRVAQHARGADIPAPQLYELFELWGRFEIPSGDSEIEPEFGEVILTYSFIANVFLRKINNPFFGYPRHIVRVPYLHQPHEIDGMGAAEQVLQFQEEASTAHNQTIDAATAAIAGIVVKKPGTNISGGEEIWPGKVIETDEPLKDFTVVHLSMGNSTLPNVEQQAAFWAEKRSGYSAYNMGVESGVAGSRATATGTTALISEGNIRFWVSIDDMRDAIVDCLYLTLQLEQQMRPGGTPIAEGRMLQLPGGDLRETLGLRLMISSEKVNRDLEIQNFQILIQVLNEYYARLMQAMGMIMNPAFPPQMKFLAVSVMEASQNLVQRFVERFDIENIDEVVPHITQALQMLAQIGASPSAQPGQMAPNPVGGPGGPPGAPPVGPPGMPQGPPVGGPQRALAAPGPRPVPGRTAS